MHLLTDAKSNIVSVVIGSTDGITDLLKGLLEQYDRMGINEEENYSEMLRVLISVEEEFHQPTVA